MLRHCNQLTHRTDDALKLSLLLSLQNGLDPILVAFAAFLHLLQHLCPGLLFLPGDLRLCQLLPQDQLLPFALFNFLLYRRHLLMILALPFLLHSHLFPQLGLFHLLLLQLLRQSRELSFDFFSVPLIAGQILLQPLQCVVVARLLLHIGKHIALMLFLILLLLCPLPLQLLQLLLVLGKNALLL